MADPHANGKTNRFVGICIQRGGKGLGATFVLRNIIDNQGEWFVPFLLLAGVISPHCSHHLPSRSLFHTT